MGEVADRNGNNDLVLELRAVSKRFGGVTALDQVGHLADGRLLSGARAFVAIWETLPAWRRLAVLARLPGIISLLEGGYRLFLPVRPLMSRIAAVLGARPRGGAAGAARDAAR